MSSPQKILIIRTSAMGDVVMASPLAEGLRIKFPEARICWLAEPQVAPLLEDNPSLDSVIVWPKLQWKVLFREKKFSRLFSEVMAFARKLRGEKFSLAVDAQGLLRTRLLAWFSGAPQRIGFESREPGQHLMTRLIPKGDEAHLMGSEYFYLLRQIGMETTAELKKSIHLSDARHTEASQALAKAGVTGPYAVFAPFTTRPQKHWFEHLWVQLAHEVSEKLNMTVIWLGGPSDASAAEALSRDGGGYNLAGKTGLGASAAIVSKAAFVVGVDTGLTHMGSAFCLPTVALFGSTCPYTETRSPYTTVLYHPLPCSPCRRTPTCNGRHDCMQAITVEEVLQAIVQTQQTRMNR